MKSCFENGIIEKFNSIMLFNAEMNGKKNADQYSMPDQFAGKPIGLDEFLRGPLKWLFICYPVIIIMFILETYFKSV